MAGTNSRQGGARIQGWVGAQSKLGCDRTLYSFMGAKQRWWGLRLSTGAGSRSAWVSRGGATGGADSPRREPWVHATSTQAPIHLFTSQAIMHSAPTHTNNASMH